MSSSDHTPERPQPATQRELEQWIEERLSLDPPIRAELLQAVDSVLTRHQQLWKESKDAAIDALRGAFASRIDQLQKELSAREATNASIARYFEQIVADLTERSHHDPKTSLMNFARFTERLHAFLMTEQRGQWCALGLADLNRFKWYNDTLGHTVGDRIIRRFAMLLREHVRSDDLIARDSEERAGKGDLHARFGGDEFCFLLPALGEPDQAIRIVTRFLAGVANYDWSIEDPRLVDRPARAAVGVVCFWLGPLRERRACGPQLAPDLVRRADELMYAAKRASDGRVAVSRLRLAAGQLTEVPAGADEESLEPRTDAEPRPISRAGW
jgi:GGDEF domain-containing protein